MFFSFLTKKLLVTSLVGGSIGGATYLGINNPSKGVDSKKIPIKEDKRSLNKKQVERFQKKIKVLVKYLLVDKGLRGCEMILSGWKKDSIMKCDYSWVKDFESSLNGKDGWVIEGDNSSINSVINGWGWISQDLAVKGLKNPWIITKDKSLSLSSECKKSTSRNNVEQMRIVCSNQTSKK